MGITGSLFELRKMGEIAIFKQRHLLTNGQMEDFPRRAIQTSAKKSQSSKTFNHQKPTASLFE